MACSDGDGGGHDGSAVTTTGAHATATTEAATSPTTATVWSSLGEIAYLLPEEPPAGWALSHATERLGRPFEEWDLHIEILGTQQRDRFLVVVVQGGLGDDALGALADEPPEPVEQGDAADGFGFLFAYTLGSYPEGAAAVGTAWRQGDLGVSVSSVAVEPDADAATAMAESLRGLDELDFDIPALHESGYAPLASSAEFGADATDYTVVFRPEELAGSTRSEGTSASDEGPTLFYNVGCRFYGQAPALAGAPTSVADAEVAIEGDLLHLEYLLNGSSIRVTGREVTEDELRAFAVGLETMDRDEWVDRVGDRLLVDEQSG